MSGMPVTSEAFDKMFEYAAEVEDDPFAQENQSSYSGFVYFEEPLDGESLEKVRRFLATSESEPEDTDAVRGIMIEEVPAYFSGNKSAQEVCDIIQNRVQLYLDER